MKCVRCGYKMVVAGGAYCAKCGEIEMDTCEACGQRRNGDEYCGNQTCENYRHPDWVDLAWRRSMYPEDR